MGRNFLEEMKNREVDINLEEGVFGDLLRATKSTVKQAVGNFKDVWKDSRLTGHLKKIGFEVLSSFKKQEEKIKPLMPYLEKDKAMAKAFGDLTSAMQNFKKQIDIRTGAAKEEPKVEPASKPSDKDGVGATSH